jgi:hypothetical protein
MAFISGGLKFRFLRKEGGNWFEILLLGGRVYRRSLKEDKKREEKKKKPSKSQFNLQDFLKLSEPFFNLIYRFKKAIKIKDVHIKSRVGFNDPSVLGTFYGVYSGVMGFLSPWIPRDKFNLEPDFSGEVFESRFSAEIEITHYTLIIPMISLFRKFRRLNRSRKGEGK